ncbi:uncharacterized protein [Haliotis cracherodii]|uniref:uncharacterized protein n=1 Tax=Haliotis cracherodii TaxID=6455 RepID=UPI0039EC5E89
MPRRKQNYPKRLKCTSQDGTGSQQQTSDSGGDDSELTSDEEGEEDEPMNSPDSNNQATAESRDSDADPPQPSTTDPTEECSNSPTSMTRADTHRKEKMDVSDSDLVRPTNHSKSPTTSPTVIVSTAAFVSKTENNHFSQTNKSMTKSFLQASNFSDFMDQDTDQPLDLSKKTDKEKAKVKRAVSNGHSTFSPSVFPSSLQSLQQRFGGDFPIEPPRRPSNSIPLQSTMIQGKPLLRSPLVIPSPNHSRTSPTLDSHKPRPSPKLEKVANLGGSPAKKMNRPSSAEAELDEKSNKYTMHKCSCQKNFTTLYSLSVHLQETGHVPGTAKATNLMDYPKLVRGQDMWLNQESEQTRRILRCMQCGESFKSLPMLTVHMMQTQHYTKIVSSDHGRRSHKCSAYCEKELDRECIFKCKVCHEPFTDMEGLCNHMIMSGHHKKQVLRTQNYPDLGMRSRRKRYYSEESSACGTPTVASLLEYKRKCISHGSNGFSPISESSGFGIESAISCENCGHKIEMHNFVEHVRLCLRQKSNVIGALKHKLTMDDSSRHRRDSSSSVSSPKHFDEARKHSRVASPSKNSPSPPSSPCSISPTVHETDMEDKPQKLNQPKQHQNVDDVNSNKLNLHDGTDCISHSVSESSDFPLDIEIKKEVDAPSPDLAESALSPCSVKQERSPSVSPTKELNASSCLQDRSEACSPQKNDENRSESRVSLDIIDPNSSETNGRGDSALKAMESFIQRSFSSKFDHHRSNMVHMMNPLNKSTLHLPGTAQAEADSAFNYFGKLRKFFNSFQPFDSEVAPKKTSLPSGTVAHPEKSTKDTDKKTAQTERLAAHPASATDTKDAEKQKTSTPKSEMSNDDAKSPAKESQPDEPSEPLVNKYLNVAEGEPVPKRGSALDSLSSFVYGQPMTSEHPLDSLQRLLTKTDIPKMLQQQMDPIACRHLMSPSEMMAVPLNLSLKHSKSDDEDDDHLDEQAEELASLRDSGSPLIGCDGELLEYKCAACSRQFASKGSYRYHLSRCHLSSVKKYGIKEAFNMSPYVYLPLDHTAKFTKYYEMAHELANKGK